MEEEDIKTIIEWMALMRDGLRQTAAAVVAIDKKQGHNLAPWLRGTIDNLHDKLSVQENKLRQKVNMEEVPLSQLYKLQQERKAATTEGTE